MIVSYVEKGIKFMSKTISREAEEIITCKLCNIPKPISEFYFDKVRNKRWLRCQECLNTRNRINAKANRLANPEKFKAKDKRDYEKNKEAKLQYKRLRNTSQKEI